MPAVILGNEYDRRRLERKKELRVSKGTDLYADLLSGRNQSTAPHRRLSLPCWKRCRKEQLPLAGTRYELEKPFFVLATQNPIEQRGYLSPSEAQLDRFLFKLIVGYSGREDLSTILDRTTKGKLITLRKRWMVLRFRSGKSLCEKLSLRSMFKTTLYASYLPRIPRVNSHCGHNKYLRWGSSPRGAQTIALAAKVRALIDGRFNVSFEDVRRVAVPSLRHRVILNFEAQAEGLTTDQVLLEILEKLPTKSDDIPVAQQRKRTYLFNVETLRRIVR